jgi:ribonuclease Z
MTFSRFAFLGTSSAVPRPGQRNVSGMLLQFCSGSSTIIDCGEGTQMQLMRSSTRLGSIDNVLITHLHGDHCFGIFGLMHTLNMTGRTSPLNVFGPTGLDELLKTVFRLTGGWDGFDIRVTELETGKIHSFNLYSSSERLLAAVTACPMIHRIPAFGYVFKEPVNPRVLDAPKATSLGAQGVDLGRLKSGEDIRLSCGTIIKSDDVTSPGAPPRTIGIMQDTCDASSAVPFMPDCDLLVHEATFEKALQDKAVEYGHSTSEMAAQIALRVNARKLVLTHFSSRYGEKGENEVLKQEAEEYLSANGGDTRVFLAADFLSFSGHDFATTSSILPPDR